MPFDRPTLAQLIQRNRSEIEIGLDGTDARLRRSVEDTFARVIGGTSHSIHGHQKYIARQIIPDTADDDFTRRWAAIFGLTQTAAVQSAGSYTFDGVDTTVIPAGTVLLREDGTEYTTDALATISGTTVTTDITAVDGGLDGNAAVGVKLNLATPITDITSEGTVAGDGLINGSDIEDIQLRLKPRMLLRIANAPKGGGPTDYEQVALAISGVTRAFEFGAHTGLGTVGLYFVQDDLADPIPLAAKVAEVQAALDAFAPITVVVTAIAPTASDLDPSITIVPDNATTQAAVTAELEAMLLREAEPGGTTKLSQIQTAIGIATGITDFTITSPAADVSLATGVLQFLGTVTYL